MCHGHKRWISTYQNWSPTLIQARLQAHARRACSITFLEQTHLRFHHLDQQTRENPTSFIKQIAAEASLLIRTCHLWFHTLVILERGKRAWLPLKIIRIQSIKLETYYHFRFPSTFVLEMWRLWSRDIDKCRIKVQRELVKRENVPPVIHDLQAGVLNLGPVGLTNSSTFGHSNEHIEISP